MRMKNKNEREKEIERENMKTIDHYRIIIEHFRRRC